MKPIKLNLEDEMCPDCIGIGWERRSNGYGRDYTYIKCPTCKGKGYLPKKKSKKVIR